MSTARDYMAKKLITFRPDQDIHQAIKQFLKHRISGAPVVAEDGRLVGILTRKDCLRVAFSASYYGDRGGGVADYMESEVRTVDVDTDIIEVAQLLLESPFHRFPVMESGHLVGQISRHDILRALEDQW
jgi:CBS domain-containing protein